MKKFVLLNLFMLVSLAFSVQTVSATPAFEFSSPGNSYTNGNWNLGVNFRVTSAVTVTGLGYYADPYTTNVDSNEVALYKADGTLLASAIVDNTYALYDHFRYVTIDSITLEAGDYQIDGVSHGNNYTWDDPGFYTDSSIQYLSNIWNLDPSNAYFQSTGGNSAINDGIWGPNLFLGQPDFTGNTPVPEPGTMALLGLGMAGLAFYGKRRQKKV